MKKEINVFDYAGDIGKALPQGILLTTKHEDKVNTMTIGWGMVGIEWGKPIFIAYVRESRFTKQLLDQSGEFTINVPFGVYDKKVLGYCGTKSGRKVDKIKECGLTLAEPAVIGTPGIKEFPLTLECKVIYKQDQDPDAIPEVIKQRYYPPDVDSTASGSNRDYHTAYYGEIVSAYILEDEK